MSPEPNRHIYTSVTVTVYSLPLGHEGRTERNCQRHFTSQQNTSLLSQLLRHKCGGRCEMMKSERVEGGRGVKLAGFCEVRPHSTIFNHLSTLLSYNAAAAVASQ